MNTSPVARTYAFHGLGLHVSADPLVAEAVHARFAQVPVNLGALADLRFQFDCVPDTVQHRFVLPATSGRPIYESAMGEVLYDDDADLLYMSYRDAVYAVCDAEAGHTRVSILQSQARCRQWLVSHPMLTLPLMETLKRRQLYSVHAAGLALEGKGLVIAGTSGAGKSTLTLALLRGGFDFLGDDMLFLSRSESGLRMHAFPDAIDITDETVGLFPELSTIREMPKDPGWPKHQVLATRHFGATTVWTCRPAAVVFPRVAGSARSVLTPLDRDEAMIELAPNILLTTTAASQAHLDALDALIENCPCYRLDTGLDLDRLPALLGSLVR